MKNICERIVVLKYGRYDYLNCSCWYEKSRKAFFLSIIPVKNGGAYPQESLKACLLTVNRYSKKQAQIAEERFWQTLESHIAIWKIRYGEN